MKYEFMEKHREAYKAKSMCEVLKVSRSGYEEQGTRGRCQFKQYTRYMGQSQFLNRGNSDNHDIVTTFSRKSSRILPSNAVSLSAYFSPDGISPWC